MASVNTHEMLTDAVIYLQKNTYSSAYMTKRDLKSLVLPLFTIVLGKNFSMTKNLLSLRLSSHH